MVFSAEQNLFIKSAGCYFFKTSPNIDGMKGDSLKVENSAFDGYKTAEADNGSQITMLGNGEAVIENLNQNYNVNFNVTKNLFKGSAADLDKCLEGTKMAGQGAALLEAQKKYGVNALFLMAIIKTESNYGAAPARDKNGIKPFNVAGLKKRGGGYQNPQNYEACIDSLSSSLSRLYFKSGKVTVDTIRKTYCPGNNCWAGKVVEEMKRLSGVIIDNYAEIN